MKNFYQLTTFVTVIAEGSMTAAADRLYLTQPAVSQQIKNLEEDLGVELLVRGVRQIKATAQGEVLFEYAKKIINLTQQAEIAIKSIGAEMKASVAIGTLNSIGLHVMSPIVGRLMRHNPQLNLKVEYAKAEDLIKSFKKGVFDILILPDVEKEYEMQLDGVDKKFLFKEELWLVASSKDEKIPSQLTVKDLKTATLCNFIDELPRFNKIFLSQCKENLDEDLKFIFESSNVGTLKRVVEAGLGWGFLPSHSIKKQVRSGRLNRIYLKDFSYDFELLFYSRKNTEKKSVVEVLYQTLSQSERT